jgi:hypothetical protein
MKQNITDFERILRAALGIYAMLLGFMFIQGLAGMILGLLGVISFVTGAVGWCGIYTLMGKEPVKSETAESIEEGEA